MKLLQHFSQSQALKTQERKTEVLRSCFKKLFKFLSKILFTLSARSTCLFMPFFACFSLFRSYIARYAPLKKEKNILKKFYKNFKDINLNSF